MENFTPYSALMGGGLIGLAVALLLLLNGQVAGVSGIIRGVLLPWTEKIVWRLCFLVGLMLAPLLYQAVGGQIVVEIKTSFFIMIVAGLLVGYGTSLASGCTSGHGVCGLSRLSARSAVATLTFMFTAAFTVYIVRHVIGGGV